MLVSLVDGLSDDAPTLDHENGDGNGTRLARFCNVAKGRALALASADDDLIVVSPDGGCRRDWAEDILEDTPAFVVG